MSATSWQPYVSVPDISCFSIYFSFVPCGGLSWLHVRLLLHVKYTLSYHIVSSAKYSSVKLFSNLYVNRANMYSTRLHSGSQCSSRRIGKMWSHRRAPERSRTATFCTNCKHCRRLSVMPYSTELQQSRHVKINAWTKVFVASTKQATGRCLQSQAARQIVAV